MAIALRIGREVPLTVPRPSARAPGAVEIELAGATLPRAPSAPRSSTRFLGRGALPPWRLELAEDAWVELVVSGRGALPIADGVALVPRVTFVHGPTAFALGAGREDARADPRRWARG